MTLFQLVTVENPVKLTPKAKDLWPQLKGTLTSVKVYDLVKNTLEGLEIGLSLVREQESPYFVEMCNRDLES